MSYIIIVIICITDMFMPMATPFELQIEALWNKIFSVLQSLTSLDVSAPKLLLEYWFEHVTSETFIHNFN